MAKNKTSDEPVVPSQNRGMNEKEADIQTVELTGSQAVNIGIMRALFRYKALRFVVFIGSASMVWSIIATILMFSAFSSKPTPQILGIDSQNRVMRLVPLDKPIFKNVIVGKMAADILADFMTTDYVHYQSHMNKIGQKYMSSSGFNAITRELNKPSGLLDFMRTNMTISTAYVKSSPTLTKSGVFGGRAARKFSFFMNIDFKGPSGSLSKQYKVMVTVLRANRLLYENGMMIHAVKFIPVNSRS